MRARILEVLLVAATAVAGILAYRAVVRPDREILARLAQDELRSIFGPDVEADRVSIDLLDGVVIEGLRVRATAAADPTLSAERVVVRHDLLALASGAYRPTEIRIEKARIVARETVNGIAPDFPFRLSDPSPGAPPARIVVRDSEVLLRSMPGSQRLREGFVARLTGVDLSLLPRRGITEIRGGLFTSGFGPENDGVRIVIGGTSDAESGRLSVRATWDPIHLTPYVYDEVLAPEVADPLRKANLERGRLVATIESDPAVEGGEVRVKVSWAGKVRMDLAEIPGVKEIDARTREQIAALLGTTALEVEVSKEGIDIRRLAADLGTGRVTARGRIEEDGEVVRIDLVVDGLRLEDPAVRRALGEEGAALFDQFEPSGEVDALIRVEKRPDAPVLFSVDAILEDASFRYLGPPPGPDGLEGFPYRVVQASGRVRITPGLVEFDDIVGVGRNGITTVRLRGSRGEAWTGGPTGRVRIDDAGTDLRITIEGTRVPVDRDLLEAVRGSEFAAALSELRLEGEIDRVELDIIEVAGRDEKAYVEARLTLDDEKFRYEPFPLDLSRVKGTVALRRPFLADGKRGKTIEFRVDGETEGAALRIEGEFRGHEDAGRVRVTGDRVPIAGPVSEALLASKAGEGGLGDLWRFLDPRGQAAVDIDFPMESDPGPVRARVDLLGASVRLDAACSPEPIEIDGLTGRIVVEGDLARIEGVRGTLSGVPVTVAGTLDGGPAGRWDLVVETGALRLTPEILGEIARLSTTGSLLPEGFVLEAGGRMALTVRFRKEPGEAEVPCPELVFRDIDASLRLPGGMSVGVRGDRIESVGGALLLSGLEVEAEGARVSIPDARMEGDDLSGELRLALDGFEVSREFLALFGEEARGALDDLAGGRRLSSGGLVVRSLPEGTLHLEGDLSILAVEAGATPEALKGKVAFAPLRLSPPGAAGREAEGSVRLEGLSLDLGLALEGLTGELAVRRLHLGDDPYGELAVNGLSGRVEGIGFEGLTAPVTWRDGILRADPILGTIARGRLAARLLVHTRDPEAYEGTLRVDDFDLAVLRDDLFPGGPLYSGLGTARISFENRGSGAADLRAEGTVSVRDGNLGDLPVVANIFALAGGVLPVEEPPRFERAEAAFTLHHETLHFERLEFQGPLFEMPGRGTLDLAGTADLTFTPDFIKSMLLPGAIQLPVIGEVVQGVLKEELLYAVRLRGDLETAKPEIVPFPFLGMDRSRRFEGTGIPSLPDRPLPRWFR